MDWVEYRELLGIGLNDKEKYEKLITNVFSVLNTFTGFVSKNAYIKFCLKTGIKVFQDDYLDDNYYDNVISDLSEHTRKPKEFLSYYVMFANIVNSSEDCTVVGYSENIDYIFVLKKQFETFHIEYDLVEDKDGVFLFPKGVAQFDKELITEVLLWLGDYPNTKKAWIQALKLYSNADKDNSASNVADMFRKTLESFFKEFFKSEKSLENLISEYGKYLGDNGIPKEISNCYVNLLKLYTAYNNNYAKHNDKVEKNVLEFIMYQTGTIIRLLIQIKN